MNTNAVISTEPAFKYGIRGVVTGRIGRAVYRVEVIGSSIHSAFYDPVRGVNLFVG